MYCARSYLNTTVLYMYTLCSTMSIIGSILGIVVNKKNAKSHLFAEI